MIPQNTCIQWNIPDLFAPNILENFISLRGVEVWL